MGLTEFVNGTAKAIDRNYEYTLADNNPVQIVWGPGSDPDTILVTDSDGDVWQLQITKLA